METKRKVALFLFLIIIVQSGTLRIQAEENVGIFDPTHERTGATLLKEAQLTVPTGHEIAMDWPKIDEKLSPDTIVFVLSSAHLSLRLESLTSEDACRLIEKSISAKNSPMPGELRHSDDVCYMIVPERTGFIFRDVLDNDLFSKISISVAGYSGTVLVSKIQPRKRRVFESERLNDIYHFILMYHGLEALANEIDFRQLKNGEELPLYSFLIADDNSKIIFKITLKDERIGASTEQMMRQLVSRYFPMAEISKAKGNDEFYLKTEGFFYILLVGLPGDDLLDLIKISVKDYDGSVFISKDVQVISALLPKDLKPVRTAGKALLY